MKKILITGLTSAALAAMPVVGVFAADPAPVQDELEVTVAESCTFTRSAGQAKYTKAMTASQVEANFGQNTFLSNCNNGRGYAVKADFVGLTHSEGKGTTIEYSTTTPSASALGIWTANDGTTNLANGSNVLDTTSADPAGGTSFSITYKVSLHDNQEQGTYGGTATYTLSQKTGA